MPDGVFRYGSVLFRRLLDNGGEVAATAVFHENIENPSVSINVYVVVSYNAVVMKVLENVPARRCCQSRYRSRSGHILPLQSAFYLARSSSQS